MASTTQARAAEANKIVHKINQINHNIQATTSRLGKDTSDVADLAQISSVLNSLIGQFKVAKQAQNIAMPTHLTSQNSADDATQNAELF